MSDENPYQMSFDSGFQRAMMLMSGMGGMDGMRGMGMGMMHADSDGHPSNTVIPAAPRGGDQRWLPEPNITEPNIFRSGSVMFGSFIELALTEHDPCTVSASSLTEQEMLVRFGSVKNRTEHDLCTVSVRLIR
jgi:hypothetical protein